MAPCCTPARERGRAQDVTPLFERYRAHGDQEALEALVERFLPLARHLARRYLPDPSVRTSSRSRRSA